MAAKQMLYDAEARSAILDGVSQLAAAVKVTLGPTGRNVLLQKSFGGPKVTKDGVTVSKEIDLPNPFMNMGAKMANQVASKTNDVVGDGHALQAGISTSKTEAVRQIVGVEIANADRLPRKKLARYTRGNAHRWCSGQITSHVAFALRAVIIANMKLDRS